MKKIDGKKRKQILPSPEYNDQINLPQDTKSVAYKNRLYSLLQDLQSSQQQRTTALITILKMLQDPSKVHHAPLFANRILAKLKDINDHITTEIDNSNQDIPSSALSRTLIAFILLTVSADPNSAAKLVNESSCFTLLLDLANATAVPQYDDYHPQIIPCISTLMNLNNTGAAAPVVQDATFTIDGANPHYNLICKKVCSEGDDHVILPIGVDSLVKIITKKSLELDPVLETETTEQEVERQEMQFEDFRIIISNTQHNVSSIISNNEKTVAPTRPCKISIFEFCNTSKSEEKEEEHFLQARAYNNIFNFLVDQMEKPEEEIVMQTPVVLEVPTESPALQKKIPRAQAVAETKSKFRKERRWQLRYVASHPDYHRHLAIRALVALMFNLPSHSIERQKFITTGGLQALFILSNYRIPIGFYRKITSSEFLKCDDTIRDCMSNTLRLSSKFCQIAVSKVSENELEKLLVTLVRQRKKRKERSSFFEVQVKNLLSYYKTIVRKKERRMNRAKQVNKGRTTCLKARLGAAKILAAVETTTTTTNQDNISTSKFKKLEAFLSQCDETSNVIASSYNLMTETQFADGIHHLDWVKTVPTVNDKRVEAAKCRQKARIAKEKEALAEAALAADHEREILEAEEMFKHDKHEETEAERRVRVELQRIELEEKKHRARIRRENEEKKRLRLEKELKAALAESRLMSKEDDMYLLKLRREKEEALAKEQQRFIEQAERIRLMKLRDKEIAFEKETTAKMTLEDALCRRIRFEEAQRAHEILERENERRIFELKEMRLEESFTRIYLKKKEEFEKKQEVERVTMKKRELRKLKRELDAARIILLEEEATTNSDEEECDARKNYNAIAERIAELEGNSATDRKTDGVSTWEERADEDGNSYYENTSTGETAWEKPGESVEQQYSQWIQVVVQVDDDGQGNIYYENTVTGETSWENPMQQNDIRSDESSSKVENDDWIMCESEEGVYYYNSTTQESSWECPSSFR